MLWAEDTPHMAFGIARSPMNGQVARGALGFKVWIDSTL